MQFVKFMTSGMGRTVRIIAGLVILSLGLLVVKGTIGTIMSIVALLPLAGGLFDYCLFGVLLGYPFWGKDVRKQLAR